jgi:hypothetical protein
MRAFSKEIIEKIKSMLYDRRKQVLEGLAKLYAVRPYRASEGLIAKTPPATDVAAEVYPQRN